VGRSVSWVLDLARPPWAARLRGHLCNGPRLKRVQVGGPSVPGGHVEKPPVLRDHDGLKDLGRRAGTRGRNCTRRNDQATGAKTAGSW